MAAKENSPVYAAGGGIVEKSGFSASLENFVSINHAFGCRTVYGHLKSSLVATGFKVAPGDLIGYSGSTGAVTGPHLHFEVYYFGRAVDPKKYLSVLINCLAR